MHVMRFMGFPGGSDGKESACNAADTGSIPGLERSPGKDNSNPLQYSRLENPTERSLAGYSPWDHRVGHRRATNTTKLYTLYLPSLVVQFISIKALDI